MSTATMADPTGAEFDASVVDRHIQRLMRIRQTWMPATWVSASILWDLQSARWRQRELRAQIATLAKLPAVPDNDREFLRERAAGFGQLARRWGAVSVRWESEVDAHRTLYPWILRRLSTTIGNQLDEIACVYEDTAETLALAANAAFTRLVHEELTAHRSSTEH